LWETWFKKVDMLLFEPLQTLQMYDDKPQLEKKNVPFLGRGAEDVSGGQRALVPGFQILSYPLSKLFRKTGRANMDKDEEFLACSSNSSMVGSEPSVRLWAALAVCIARDFRLPYLRFRSRRPVSAQFLLKGVRGVAARGRTGCAFGGCAPLVAAGAVRFVESSRPGARVVPSVFVTGG
jgi:hypothetical protein